MLSLLQKLNDLRPLLASAAQSVVDEWVQDEDGMDAELGGGGACDLVSSAMSEVISSHIEDAEIVDGGHEGDDHAWLIVFDSTEAVGVDIPPGVYETGGGYSWKKIENVEIEPTDVVLWNIDRRDIMASSSPDVKWVKPNLDEEAGEFERIVDEGYASNFDEVFESAKHGKLVRLDLEDPRWRNIENADSGQDLTLDEAREMAGEYGRNIDRILDGIRNGDSIPAPIVLEQPDGSLHNVAGNTRLMVCRALGISPLVWWVRHPDLKNPGKAVESCAQKRLSSIAAKVCTSSKWAYEGKFSFQGRTYDVKVRNDGQGAVVYQKTPKCLFAKDGEEWVMQAGSKAVYDAAMNHMKRQKVASEEDDMRLQPGPAFHLQPDGTWAVEDVTPVVAQDARFSGFLAIEGYWCAVFELNGEEWAQKVAGNMPEAEEKLASIARRIAGIRTGFNR